LHRVLKRDPGKISVTHNIPMCLSWSGRRRHIVQTGSRLAEDMTICLKCGG
jgi:hypothetical protein